MPKHLLYSDGMKRKDHSTRSVQLSSTIHFSSLTDYKAAGQGQTIAHGQTAMHVDNGYGLQGNPTLHELQDAISHLEQGKHTLLFPSGLTALVALGALLNSGDHWLMPDSVYSPLRRFAEQLHRQYGISYSTYDPADLHTLEHAITPRTRLIHIETPSSITFEVTNIAAVVRIAKAHGITTSADNTWASGVLIKPLEHGVDISIVSLTKYIAGYSDVFMGSLTTKNLDLFKQFAYYHKVHGHTVSPFSAMLVNRSLESLAVRLSNETEHAKQLAAAIAHHPKVHHIYKVEANPKLGIAGPNSLLTIELDKIYSDTELEAPLAQLQVFKIGESWGGTRSLVLPFQPQDFASRRNPPKNTLIRFHTGLENFEQQLADVQAFLQAL